MASWTDTELATAQDELTKAQHALQVAQNKCPDPCTDKKKKKEINQKQKTVDAKQEIVNRLQSTVATRKAAWEKDGLCANAGTTQLAGATWSWYKNKVPSGYDGTIKYFRSTFSYRGVDYYLVAHIHGTYNGDTWQYDNRDVGEGAADKYEVFRISDHSNPCPKTHAAPKHSIWRDKISKLDQSAIGSLAKADKNAASGSWPARFMEDNYYGDYYNDLFGDDYFGDNVYDVQYLEKVGNLPHHNNGYESNYDAYERAGYLLLFAASFMCFVAVCCLLWCATCGIIAWFESKERKRVNNNDSDIDCNI